MDPDTPATNPDDLLAPRPPQEEKKMGEHGQIGNLQDPSKDQASDAQLNHSQGKQGQHGQQSQGDGKIEISHKEEEDDDEEIEDDDMDTDDDDDDVFSDEASNHPAQRHKVMDGGPTDKAV
jgi:hypothetical protein